MDDSKVKIIIFDKDKLTKTLVEDYIKDIGIDFEVITYEEYDKKLITDDNSFKYIIISSSERNDSVLNDIKELSENKNNIFIFLSSAKDTDLYVMALRAGVKEFLLKPLVKKDFISAIKNNYNTDLSILYTDKFSKVITVTSDEIGCGKTFFAINIARELAGVTKEKVLLVDFNNNLNNVSFSLDIDPVYDTNYYIQNTRVDNYDKVFSQVYRFKKSSLYIISNGLYIGIDDSIDVDNLLRFFRHAKKYYKYVVVDVNQSIEELCKLIYDLSDIMFYLMSPNITTCEKNRKYVTKFLTNYKYKLILNKYKTKDESKLNDIEAMLGYEIFEKIPMNLTVSMGSANRGKTIREVSPDSDIVKVYNKLAGYIIHRV